MIDPQLLEAATAEFASGAELAAAYIEENSPQKAVRHCEVTLRRHQEVVHFITDTRLSFFFEQLCIGYNAFGMTLMASGKHDLALKELQKAETITEPANFHMERSRRLTMRAITWNNLGCFYKSTNKLHAALEYLKKCSKLEYSGEIVPPNPASTEINICVVLSRMGRHDVALEHGRRALVFFQTLS